MRFSYVKSKSAGLYFVYDQYTKPKRSASRDALNAKKEAPLC